MTQIIPPAPAEDGEQGSSVPLPARDPGSKTRLSYRLAKTPEDKALLKQYRVECGWGVEKIDKFWEDPDRPFCIFSLQPTEGNDQGLERGNGTGDSLEGGAPSGSTAQADGVIRGEDVGMGGWILELEGDEETASRSTGAVQLSSLFIREKYRRFGLGSHAMTLLEQAAVQAYGASSITLDTTAYECTPRTDEMGRHYFDENFEKVGKSVNWYLARGYRQYRENSPQFLHPTPTDPNRKLTAMFLRKEAGYSH